MKTQKIAECLVFIGLAVATSAGATSGHLDGYIPSAAHAPGRFGSFWTTDVWIYHQGATTVHLWFNPSGADNSQAESTVVQLTNPTTVITDVVANLFGEEGVGSIHYLADGPVTVTSRTWTTAQGGGGYGQTIAGIPLSEASVSDTGQAGALRMVADQVPGSRANLGLVNVTRAPVSVRVEVFDPDGEAAPGDSTFEVDLNPFEMTQVNDIFQRLDPGLRPGLIVRASVSSDQGAIVAYLSTVDNTTNDASYQSGFRFGY